MACPEFATLPNGTKMHLLGYGTWQSTEEVLEAALNSALEAGYRHIDTAFAYGNEEVVGRVLQEKWLKTGRLRREDLFLVTKLPQEAMTPGKVGQYMQMSLQALRVDYVDLYLVHSSFQIGPKAQIIDHVALWKEMEDQVEAGRAKAIGLSKFNKRQIQNVLDHCRIKPANLQVELHLHMQQKPLVEFCHAHGITVTAFSPIGSPSAGPVFKQRFGVDIKLPSLLEQPVVVEVARKHGKTPAQVLLRHIVQHGIAAIPKSVNKERIAQNIDIFDFALDADDMARLDRLDKGEDGRIFDFDWPGVNKDSPNFPFHEYP